MKLQNVYIGNKIHLLGVQSAPMLVGLILKSKPLLPLETWLWHGLWHLWKQRAGLLLLPGSRCSCPLRVGDAIKLFFFSPVCKCRLIEKFHIFIAKKSSLLLGCIAHNFLELLGEWERGEFTEEALGKPHSHCGTVHYICLMCVYVCSACMRLMMSSVSCLLIFRHLIL